MFSKLGVNFWWYSILFTVSILQKPPVRIGDLHSTRSENVGSNIENPCSDERQLFHTTFSPVFIFIFYFFFFIKFKFSLFHYYRNVAFMNHFLIILIILFRSKSILIHRIFNDVVIDQYQFLFLISSLFLSSIKI